jgi:hypothetical protein
MGVDLSSSRCICLDKGERRRLADIRLGLLRRDHCQPFLNLEEGWLWNLGLVGLGLGLVSFLVACRLLVQAKVELPMQGSLR